MTDCGSRPTGGRPARSRSASPSASRTWTTLSGCVRSSRPTPIAAAGAPKRRNADRTRSAFSGSQAIQSRSPVARGTPCTASACAPTTRKRASAPRSAARGPGSPGSLAQAAEGLERQRLHHRETPFRSGGGAEVGGGFDAQPADANQPRRTIGGRPGRILTHTGHHARSPPIRRAPAPPCGSPGRVGVRALPTSAT